MKEILIIHTGGTISMSKTDDGHVETNGQHPLLNIIPSHAVNIRQVELFSLPSPHITPEHMLELAHYISTIQTENTSGIVITHGTDTLEETAFFLDCTIHTSIPVVITGAMRSSNELGSDGLYNLTCAIQVASEPQAKDHGILVVMNDEIHAAKYVTKTSTSNVATFRSPPVGPIGFVNKNSIIFYQKLTNAKEIYKPKELTRNILLLKAYTGMSAALMDCLEQQSPDGLVIEAFGQGNLPPAIMPAMERLINKGVVIVIVTRCYKGRVHPTYNYPGGGNTLQNLGAILANSVNGPKARLKLMLLLENKATLEQIKVAFHY